MNPKVNRIPNSAAFASKASLRLCRSAVVERLGARALTGSGLRVSHQQRPCSVSCEFRAVPLVTRRTTCTLRTPCRSRAVSWAIVGKTCKTSLSHQVHLSPLLTFILFGGFLAPQGGKLMSSAAVNIIALRVPRTFAWFLICPVSGLQSTSNPHDMLQLIYKFIAKLL